jgi:hypothetical protein
VVGQPPIERVGEEALELVVGAVGVEQRDLEVAQLVTGEHAVDLLHLRGSRPGRVCSQ